MSYLKIVLFVFIGSIANGCSEPPDDPGPTISVSPSTTTTNNASNSDDLSNTDFNILFIGNSLTYTNDLPKLVKERAKLRGITIGTTTLAEPNYAILDHWDDGKAQDYIKEQVYDFVIVQQGPSSQAFGREVLIEYGKKFANLCNENGAELCFFMVWPSLTFYHTFDGVIKNYSDAADMNNAILLPVGRAWKEYFDTTNNFDYYQGDGFHPSATGSRAAAIVIVDTLF